MASRHPDRPLWPFSVGDQQPVPVVADIRDEQSVAEAVFGAYGVVNAVSLYVER